MMKLFFLVIDITSLFMQVLYEEALIKGAGKMLDLLSNLNYWDKITFLLITVFVLCAIIVFIFKE